MQEGRPRRRFEQYADYSSSEEQSMDEDRQPDMRLPHHEEAEDFFMEDLFVDTEDELLREERLTDASDMELYPDLVADDWNREPTPEDRHISDSSPPDFDDPLDSILRRQLPQQTQYSPSDDSEADQQPKPIESRMDDPPSQEKKETSTKVFPTDN